MTDPEIMPISPQYAQTLEWFGQHEAVTATRIKRLQRGRESEIVGEGPVHLVKFSSQNPQLNDLICVEKQIYPRYRERAYLSPSSQLAKYEAIKAQGGIVPDWMCVSVDGQSLYSHDLSNNGTLTVIDTNKLLLYDQFVIPEQPWILERGKEIFEQVVLNLVAAAKADMLAAADSMLLVNSPNKVVYMADFGAGVEQRGVSIRT